MKISDIEALPPSLVAVAEVIGLPATLALVEVAGGIRIYVPERLSDDHRLVAWIGREAAARLSECFAMEELVIPRCVEALRRVRNQQIRHERAQGARPAELALRYRLTERQVYAILANDGMTDSPQISLL